MAAPQISVILCTWNRAAVLPDALAALLAQPAVPEHEIIVVDNGSTDDTARVVGQAAARSPRVRYVVEPRLGVSHARNTGVQAAQADVLVFTDDDVRVGEGWMAALAGALERYGDAAYLGGPVLPVWKAPAPPWLTTQHWAALGIQDYGTAPLPVGPDRPLCLISANLAIRRAAFTAAGGFDPAVQRCGGSVCSTEDHDIQVRLWALGYRGMYVPGLAASAIVGPERLRKAHHRAWRYSHGRHIARMRLSDMEASAHRVFGTPGHLLRQAAADARALVVDLLRGDRTAAFEHEARLWFALGFVRERWA